MGSMKVIIDDKVEKEFRRVAMKKYGYGKGALSEAAEAAFDEWSSNQDRDVTVASDLSDPVIAIEGLLRNVRANSVELQHEATKVRAKKTNAKTSR